MMDTSDEYVADVLLREMGAERGIEYARKLAGYPGPLSAQYARVADLMTAQVIPRLYKDAAEIGNNRAALLRRLKDARSVLKTEYRDRFKTYIYDFDRKCMIGAGYILQWVNDGRTNRGTVYCAILEKNFFAEGNSG